MAKQVIIGLMFGCVSAFASGYGVNWLGTVVNVRDAAPLIAGLVFGWWRAHHPTMGVIPEAALWVFNNMGLNIFIAIIGISLRECDRSIHIKLRTIGTI